MNRNATLIILGTALAVIAGCSDHKGSEPTSAATPDATSTDTNGPPDTNMDGAAETAPPMDASGASTQNDQGFFEKAAEGGMAEVEAGKLAQSKGSSAGVKSFGAMMVKDHSKANEKLQKIAADSSVTLPSQLNAEHEAMRATLSGLSGKEFDQEYIRGQIKDHQATAELLQTEIDSGTNPNAKAFASETLPTVQAHLEKVKKLAATFGVDAT